MCIMKKKKLEIKKDIMPPCSQFEMHSPIQRVLFTYYSHLANLGCAAQNAAKIPVWHNCSLFWMLSTCLNGIMQSLNSANMTLPFIVEVEPKQIWLAWLNRLSLAYLNSQWQSTDEHRHELYECDAYKTFFSLISYFIS